MNPSGPLRANLSRYRRHKLSSDGETPGIEYLRFQGGIDRPMRSNEVGQRPAGTTYNNAQLPVVYDPGIGPYHFDTPAYDHPEPWHEAAAHGAPWPPPGQIPIVPQQHMGPPIDHETAVWLLRRFVNDVPGQPAPDAIPDGRDARCEGPVGPTEHLTENMPISEIWDRVLSHPTYDSALMSPEMFDRAMTPTGAELMPPAAAALPEDAEAGLEGIADYVESGSELSDPDFGALLGFDGSDQSVIPDCPPGPGMDPMAPVLEPAGLAPDQLEYAMPLEDIVAQEMQEMDPYAMMDPYHAMGRYGPMPDPRMMGMPMNPFGFNPFGVGPMMGPM